MRRRRSNPRRRRANTGTGPPELGRLGRRAYPKSARPCENRARLQGVGGSDEQRWGSGEARRPSPERKSRSGDRAKAVEPATNGLRPATKRLRPSSGARARVSGPRSSRAGPGLSGSRRLHADLQSARCPRRERERSRPERDRPRRARPPLNFQQGPGRRRSGPTPDRDARRAALHGPRARLPVAFPRPLHDPSVPIRARRPLGSCSCAAHASSR